MRWPFSGRVVRGVGGMGDNEYVEAELESRGITSCDEERGLSGHWEEIARRDVATAAGPKDQGFWMLGKGCRIQILEDVVIRQEAPTFDAQPAYGIIGVLSHRRNSRPRSQSAWPS